MRTSGFAHHGLALDLARTRPSEESHLPPGYGNRRPCRKGDNAAADPGTRSKLNSADPNPIRVVAGGHGSKERVGAGMEQSGFRLYPERLSASAQAYLVEAVFAAAESAPFYRPITPAGRPMSVEMTNLGPLGWVTDGAGYRYEPLHPVTGLAWPPVPIALRELWADVADCPVEADSCLVNLYRQGARMGAHQDRDEADFGCPVLSVSLGDTAIFRLGGPSRRSPTRSFRLASGDVCVLAGGDRLAFHGVDRVLTGSSRLIPGGGRLNLTMRRARPISP
jgi:alkylated DNA repair protein (DNA oxidative demethylase)